MNILSVHLLSPIRWSVIVNSMGGCRAVRSPIVEHLFYMCGPSKRLFSARCARCRHPFDRNQLVMIAPVGRLFHVVCFRCDVCHVQLEPGDEFGVRPEDGSLVCRSDFHDTIVARPPLPLPPQPMPLNQVTTNNELRAADGANNVTKPRDETVMTPSLCPTSGSGSNNNNIENENEADGLRTRGQFV